MMYLELVLMILPINSILLAMGLNLIIHLKIKNETMKSHQLRKDYA
jgi:hypothetical protein